MVHLQDRTLSMGLKLKPRKYKSLSIKAGKSVSIGFYLGDSLNMEGCAMRIVQRKVADSPVNGTGFANEQ